MMFHRQGSGLRRAAYFIVAATCGVGCRNLDDDPTACSQGACGADSTTDSHGEDRADAPDARDAADSSDASDVDAADTADTADSHVDADSTAPSDTDAGTETDAASDADAGPTAHWTPMSASPLLGRAKHAAVWTGTQMIVWGGSNAAGTTYYRDGAKYDPATDAWTPIALPPTAIIGRNDFAAAWTGSKMVIWGGQNGPGPLGDGAAYDPVTDSWTTLEVPTISARIPAYGFVKATGDLFVWSASDGAANLNDGAYYHAPSGHWTSMPSSPLAARTSISFTASNSLFIAFGGTNGTTYLDDGASFDALTSTWTPLGAVPAGYVPRIWAGQASVGGGLIVLGGANSSGASLQDGIYFDGSGVASAVPSITAAVLAVPDRVYPQVWCDGVDLCWYWSGGHIAGSTPTIASGGARYSISGGSWSAMTAPSEPTPRVRASVVWTGTSAIVWGGEDGTTEFNDGAIYTP